MSAIKIWKIFFPDVQQETPPPTPITYTVVFTPWANRRMRDIYAFWKKRSTAEIADQIVHNILSHAKMLERNPQVNPLEEDINEGYVNFRKFTFWRFKIIYTIDESELQVIIADILYNWKY